MGSAVTVVSLVYFTALACYGQWQLFTHAVDWFDRRYGQPWLERRIAAAERSGEAASTADKETVAGGGGGRE